MGNLNDLPHPPKNEVADSNTNESAFQNTLNNNLETELNTNNSDSNNDFPTNQPSGVTGSLDLFDQKNISTHEVTSDVDLLMKRPSKKLVFGWLGFLGAMLATMWMVSLWLKPGSEIPNEGVVASEVTVTPTSTPESS